jgi:hypothetical protein
MNAIALTLALCHGERELKLGSLLLKEKGRR